MRILWSNLYSLLDTSSGASMSARAFLREISLLPNVTVRALGATIFDEAGGELAYGQWWPKIRAAKTDVVQFPLDGYTYDLVRTEQSKRQALSTRDQENWSRRLRELFDEYEPDIYLSYGGQMVEMFGYYEARKRRIATCAYLVSDSYTGLDWCHDVDVVLTDTRATANLYKDREGLTVYPIGKFIKPFPKKNDLQGKQTHITMVNCAPEKGGYIFAALAHWMQTHRPDVKLICIESRGSWEMISNGYLRSIGESSGTINNVEVIKFTADMPSILNKTKVLFLPCLRFESGARTIVEALSLGVPIYGTDYGGTSELVGKGGILFNLDKKFHEPPYRLVPSPDEIGQIATNLLSVFDNEDGLYDQLSKEALAQFKTINISGNVKRLYELLNYARQKSHAYDPCVHKQKGTDHA